MEPFWMVYRDGGGASTVKHDTIDSASTEAERLAKAFPGGVFVVLEAIGRCQKTPPVQWERPADLNLEIPF